MVVLGWTVWASQHFPDFLPRDASSEWTAFLCPEWKHGLGSRGMGLTAMSTGQVSKVSECSQLWVSWMWWDTAASLRGEAISQPQGAVLMGTVHPRLSDITVCPESPECNIWLPLKPEIKIFMWQFFKIFFLTYWFERERETLVCCSTFSCIHWLILVCAPTGDGTHNCGAWDDALTNLTTRPGLCDSSWLLNICHELNLFKTSKAEQNISLHNKDVKANDLSRT